MITTKNLHKHYENLHVLKGIDLSVEKSQIVCITGPSGAGKTTLLQILGTLDKPDRSNPLPKLYIDGVDVLLLKQNALADFRNQKIGFIFQFHQLLPEFNAIENVFLPGLIAKKSKKELQRRAEELLDFLGVLNRKKHKPSELSGGEQQRVAIARALINEPTVILADEPSGNLDSANAEKLHQLFLDLRLHFKQTFVIITHNQDLAALADRKLSMKDGLFLSNIKL